MGGILRIKGRRKRSGLEEFSVYDAGLTPVKGEEERGTA